MVSELTPGALIGGRFRVIRSQASSSDSTIYEAEHTGLRTRHSVKVVAGPLEDDHAKRLQRDARAAVQINHRGVVAVSDLGSEPDGSFYLAMEYLEGETLAKMTSEGSTVPLATALRVVERLADAVDAIHDRGVLHRRLSPKSVVVVDDDDGEPEPKIIGFGAAKLPSAEAATAALTTGLVLDGLGYWSPEQAMGEEVGPATDRYAFAAIAYLLIAGRPAVRPGAPGRMMVEICEGAPASPVGLSPATNAVFRRALARHPADRFPSARAFAASLAGALSGNAVPSPGETTAAASTPYLPADLPGYVYTAPATSRKPEPSSPSLLPAEPSRASLVAAEFALTPAGLPSTPRPPVLGTTEVDFSSFEGGEARRLSEARRDAEHGAPEVPLTGLPRWLFPALGTVVLVGGAAAIAVAVGPSARPTGSTASASVASPSVSASAQPVVSAPTASTGAPAAASSTAPPPKRKLPPPKKK